MVRLAGKSTCRKVMSNLSIINLRFWMILKSESDEVALTSNHLIFTIYALSFLAIGQYEPFKCFNNKGVPYYSDLNDENI